MGFCFASTWPKPQNVKAKKDIQQKKRETHKPEKLKRFGQNKLKGSSEVARDVPLSWLKNLSSFQHFCTLFHFSQHAKC